MSLQSSSQNLLFILPTKIDDESRAFGIDATLTLNALTLDTKNAVSLAAFKSRFNNELFLAAYD